MADKAPDPSVLSNVLQEQIAEVRAELDLLKADHEESITALAELRRMSGVSAEIIQTLERAVSAYVQRQAGEQVARGLMSLEQAHGWAQREISAINSVLGEIAAKYAPPAEDKAE